MLEFNKNSLPFTLIKYVAAILFIVVFLFNFGESMLTSPLLWLLGLGTVMVWAHNYTNKH